MKKSIGAKTIVYPTPVFVVGTYDNGGKANVMTVAWGGICCSSPPCVAISLRKATYTFGNITSTKAFTINIPSQSQAAVADYIGSVSGKREDKFAVAGLTPVKSDIVNAPYVKEFPLVLECRVIHVIEIGLHTQFIGEILDIKVDEDRLADANLPDIEKVKPFIYVPDRQAYYGIGDYLGKAFSIGNEIKKL
jgi:flavin reductase (DIM6/NTAB) family NADH-FMN oxidoreductase RutF